jgi:hypothetical protein
MQTAQFREMSWRVANPVVPSMDLVKRRVLWIDVALPAVAIPMAELDLAAMFRSAKWV